MDYRKFIKALSSSTAILPAPEPLQPQAADEWKPRISLWGQPSKINLLSSQQDTRQTWIATKRQKPQRA
jgi:hypothetical protein